MVDPRIPVVVGVGQFTERIDDPSYRGMSAVELATAPAASAALADTGTAAAAVAKAVDTVFGTAPVRDLRTDACSAGQVQQLPAFGSEPAGRQPRSRGA